MFITFFTRDTLRAEAEGLCRRLQKLFPDGDQPAVWQFTPHNAWERVETAFEPIPSHLAVTIEGQRTDIVVYTRQVYHRGHEVPPGALHI